MIMSENEKTSPHWWLSDGFLGAMVVLLTAATAFAAYQSALTGIEGDDLDLEAQNTLVVAMGSFLNGNAEFIQDMQAYDAYRFFSDDDPAEAAVYLERMSERLQARLEQPGSPFDEGYLQATYAEGQTLIVQVEELETQANQIDDKNRIYELSGLIFAIGLAATAWASLVHPERRIRSIFLLIALVCLFAGVGVIMQIVIA
jgi:hypothetical protein